MGECLVRVVKTFKTDHNFKKSDKIKLLVFHSACPYNLGMLPKAPNIKTFFFFFFFLLW